MTKPCPTCRTPNACEIGNLCAYRDMAVIERVLDRADYRLGKAIDRRQRGDFYAVIVGAVIIAAFGVWLVAMLVKTGV